MVKLTRVYLSALGLSALLLVGCGGGGGGDGGGSPSESNNLTPAAMQEILLSIFQEADVVVGQADFTGGDANQLGYASAVGANTIAIPIGNPGVHNGVLYLPDSFNNRLLGFNAIPSVNNMNADFVLGQPDFTSRGDGTSATEFDINYAVSFDQGKMFVADKQNSRVLIWDSAPINGGVPADHVVGQPDMDSSGNGCSANGLSGPGAGWAVGGKFIVTDAGNNRVLIWNTIPTSSGVAADIVLGQQSFGNCAVNDSDDDGASDTPTASTLNGPTGVWSDGTRLVVLDTDNNRALIWNSFPTSNFAPADVVLGQGDFVNGSGNDNNQDGFVDANPTARTFYFPIGGVYSNGQQLFITDTANARVLVWNNFPTSNFSPADVVLGQGGFSLGTSNDDNQDGFPDIYPTARTLLAPMGVFQVGNQLIVSDTYNHRFLIYNGQ